MLAPVAMSWGFELKDQGEIERIDWAEDLQVPVPQPQTMNVGKLFHPHHLKRGPIRQHFCIGHTLIFKKISSASYPPKHSSSSQEPDNEC